MNQLLTPRQVAYLLQVKPTTVYQWVHRGLIPYVKIGNGRHTVRFKGESVQKWIDEKEENKRKGNFQ